MAGQTQTAIRVEGLNELRRDFAKAGKETRRAFTAAMKSIAAGVADTARSIASREGLFESGELINKIKPSVKGTIAYIRTDAVRDGYRYPGRYEFGDLDRPFLQPALERDQEKIVNELDDALKRLTSRFNLN